jgi:hypothetical protein
MRRPRARLTVRWMMIAVALVGLNLAGAIAISRFYAQAVPTTVPVPLPHTVQAGGRFITYHADGSITTVSGNLEDPTPLKDRPSTLLKPPTRRLPLPHLRIWFPVIASVTISLLVIGVAAVWTPRAQLPK